jgi:hypothetical protein
MKARMLNRIVVVKLGNKVYEKNHFHAVIKGEEVQYHLASFAKSSLSDEDGDYLIGVQGKLTDEVTEKISEIAYELNLPNPYGEDESLDVPTDID